MVYFLNIYIERFLLRDDPDKEDGGRQRFRTLHHVSAPGQLYGELKPTPVALETTLHFSTLHFLGVFRPSRHLNAFGGHVKGRGGFEERLNLFALLLQGRCW